MSHFGIGSLKTALSQALECLPDWRSLQPVEKGKVIDQSFKQLMKDLMNQFGMKPGVDYVDNLRDNEQISDFVALSKQADDLITGLMSKQIIAISTHKRVSKLGNQYVVKAHFRKKSA
ncbi:MAG: hypothetical protein ACLFV6_02005 [Spirulinaceae cyanobacterium]